MAYAKFIEDSSDYSLSNGDLTAERILNDSGNSVEVNYGFTSGKLYWEFLVGAHGASELFILGASESGTSIGQYPGATATSYGYRSDGLKARNGSAAAYGDSYTTGDIVGVALDLNDNKIWFSKNGVWQDSGDPVAGTGEAYSSVAGNMTARACCYYDDEIVTLQADPGDLSYTAPTGFLPLEGGIEIAAGFGLGSEIALDQAPRFQFAAGFGLGSEVEIDTRRIDLISAGFGLGSIVEIDTRRIDSVVAGFGLGSTTQASTTKAYELSAGFGLGSSVSINIPQAYNVIAGFGLGSVVAIEAKPVNNITAGLGLGSSIFMSKESGVAVSVGFGIGSDMSMTNDDYTCSITSHNSNRWS